LVAELVDVPLVWIVEDVEVGTFELGHPYVPSWRRYSALPRVFAHAAAQGWLMHESGGVLPGRIRGGGRWRRGV